MSFLTVAALAVGLLVVAPFIAHLLRRKPPEEVPFTAVKLVPATPAIAQRRTALEDRALFAVRALAVLALAILGATPFVTCQRLSLARQGGASVAIAIVVDDSLSMRVRTGESDAEAQTRFARAKQAADELLIGLQEGDAVAIVLAGAPPRVGLAATTNLDAAKEAVASAEQTDRGTDLQGAVKLAGELLRELSHVDKRVVVLSDLADGGSEATALEAPEGTKLWVPLDELQGVQDDCAVIGAERTGPRIAVRVACGPLPEGAPEARRKLQVRSGEDVLVEVPIRRVEGPQDITVSVPEGASLDAAIRLYVQLTGGDAIAADDEAPVVTIGGKLRVGVAADATESQVATGGPPPVEQAFAALELGVQVRPLSTVPDRAADLDELGLLIVDDVPGFTPSQRRELAAWVERGGVLLLSLGPGAASAPIGQGFKPMVPGLIRWQKEAPKGIDLAQDQLFADASAGFDDVAPKGRAELELEASDDLRTLVAWADGAPFAIEHRLGRGVVVALTLPFDVRQSDLVLRPGFLELLKRMTDTARTLGGVSRSTVGIPWTLQGFEEVKVARMSRSDERVPLDVEMTPGGKTRRVVPELAGLYALDLDGNTTTRVAAVSEPEVDLRPRPSAPGHQDEGLGGVEASVDVSSHVALGLIALMLLELVLRLGWRRSVPAAAE